MIQILDRLRAYGVDERIIQVERDGWILLAAHSPERVPEWAARKQKQIADPPLIDFYLTLGQALDHVGDDPKLVELVDRLAAYLAQMVSGQDEDNAGDIDVEPPFARLMDTLAFDTAPPARRLIELLKRRGWTGWTKLERVAPASNPAGTTTRAPTSWPD